MRALLPMSILVVLVHAVAAVQGQARDPSPPCCQDDLKQDVIACLSASQDGRWLERGKLLKLGVRAFPIYDSLLADPKLEDLHASRIFAVLCDVKGDRTRYLVSAQLALRNPNWHVRSAAVRFLAHIASPRDTSPIVAVLFDNNDVVAHAAATTLAAIGGPNDLIAMDVYLRSTAVQGAHPAFLAEITKQRDRLRERLARASNPLPKSESVPNTSAGGYPIAPPPRAVGR